MLLSSLALLSIVRNFDMPEKFLEIAVGTTEAPPFPSLSVCIHLAPLNKLHMPFCNVTSCENFLFIRDMCIFFFAACGWIVIFIMACVKKTVVDVS